MVHLQMHLLAADYEEIRQIHTFKIPYGFLLLYSIINDHRGGGRYERTCG